MGKLDALRQAGSAMARESMGAGRAAGLPAGMEGIGASAMPARLEGTSREKSALRIPPGRIVPDPDQPRAEFDPDEMDRLTRSVARDGVLQPIRVRWDEGRGAYVVLMGERRWRAATAAGLPEIPCIVHEGAIGAAEKLGLQLVENALRHDLRPVEQANAYRRLMEARGWTAKQLADELSLNKSSMTRALALLGLPPLVQQAVERGDLPPSAAAEIAKLPDPGDQAIVAEAAVAHNLTRDQVAAFVQSAKAGKKAPAARPDPVSIDLGNVVVTVKWKKPDPMTGLQALARATKELKAREQARGSDAA